MINTKKPFLNCSMIVVGILISTMVAISQFPSLLSYSAGYQSEVSGVLSILGQVFNGE